MNPHPRQSDLHFASIRWIITSGYCLVRNVSSVQDLTLKEAEDYGVVQRPSARAISQKAKLTAADDTSALVELLLSQTKLDPDVFMRDGLGNIGLSQTKRKSADLEPASPLDLLAPGVPSSANNALPISSSDDSPSWLPVALGRRKRITGGWRANYTRKVTCLRYCISFGPFSLEREA